MKKVLLGVVCLGLLFVSVSSLEAAECGSDPVLEPQVSTPAPGSESEATPEEATELLQAGLVTSLEVLEFEICNYWACIQTPTGCGCAGFYCNGHFICGYRIKW